MNRNPLRFLKTTLFSSLFLIIGVYGAFQAHKFLTGPVITVLSPQNGTVYSSAFIEVRGKTQNVSHIEFNGRKIFTDTDGNFHEKLLLYPGYNILVLDAEDKFGKSVEKKLELVLKEY